MNEIEELRKKYEKAVRDAKQAYIDDVYKLLEEHGLMYKVVRKEDGKKGWLKVDYSLRVNFYPAKKDGTMSRNSSGWTSQSHLLEEFEPYKGAKDEGMD